MGYGPTRKENKMQAKKDNKILNQYQNYSKKKIILACILFLLLIALIFISLSLGSSSFGVRESLQSFLFFFFPDSKGTIAYHIIWSLRLPRVLMGVVAGIALGSSGLIMQSILHNPLASPYTLGISSAASFGAALTIILRNSFTFLSTTTGYEVPTILSAFFFSAICILIIYILSQKQKSSSGTIILLGIAMMYLFSAGLSLLQYIGDPDELAELVYWMFGSLSRSNWSRLSISSILVFIILPFLFCTIILPIDR
ncbi:MAG: FecCD family ABC transporter permease, partial [bacterium]